MIQSALCSSFVRRSVVTGVRRNRKFSTPNGARYFSTSRANPTSARRESSWQWQSWSRYCAPAAAAFGLMYWKQNVVIGETSGVEPIPFQNAEMDFEKAYQDASAEQREMVHCIFERHLDRINRIASDFQQLSCFVSYSSQLKASKQFLDKLFLLHAHRSGIKVVCARPNLPPGESLSGFERLVLKTDKVVVLFTEEAHAKVRRQHKDPTKVSGFGREVEHIRTRIDGGVQAGTIIPIALQGGQKAIPQDFMGLIWLNLPIEPSLATYYKEGVRLFAGIRGIKREVIHREYLQEALSYLRGEKTISREELEEHQKVSQQLYNEALLDIDRATLAHRRASVIFLPEAPQHFTGREEALQQLKQLLQSHTRVAVAGLGGTGKTALALRYANQQKSNHDILYFIDGSDPTSIERGLLQLADEMKIFGEETAERLDNLQAMLRAKSNSLLIFDGVDSMESFQYLESHLDPQAGSVIVTTRSPEESSAKLQCVPLPLSGLSANDAVTFIEKQVGQTQGVVELAKAVGYLPLALTHACAYIRQRGITLSTFLQKFRDKQTALFSEPISKPTDEQTILTTWNMSLQGLSEEALDLLNLCSFLSPSDISFSVLNQLDLKRHPSFWGDFFQYFRSANPAKSIDDVVKEVVDCSMMGISQPEWYQMHALVQQVIREQLPDEQKLYYLRKAIDLFTPIAEAYKNEKFTDFASVAPHVQRLLIHVHKLDIEDRGFWLQVMGLEEALGIYLHTSAFRVRTAKNHHLRALKLKKELLGERHFAVAVSCSHLASIHEEMGKLKKALRYEKRALNIREKSLGENHLDIAESYCKMARILRNWKTHEKVPKNGRDQQLNQALEYEFKALEIRKKLLGEKHLDIAKSYESIGETLRRGAGYEPALTDVIKFQVLGSHPASKTGLEWQMKALELCKELGGEKSLATASILDGIGANLTLMGREEEGFEHRLAALGIRKERLGNKHPLVADSYKGVSFALEKLGRYDESLDYGMKALELYQELFGEKHIEISQGYFRVGRLLLEKFDDFKGLDYLHKSLVVGSQLDEKLIGAAEKMGDALRRIQELRAKIWSDEADPKLRYFIMPLLKTIVKTLEVKQSILGRKKREGIIQSDSIPILLILKCFTIDPKDEK